MRNSATLVILTANLISVFLQSYRLFISFIRLSTKNHKVHSFAPVNNPYTQTFSHKFVSFLVAIYNIHLCCSVILSLVLYVPCCTIVSRAQTHELQQCLRIGCAACIRLGPPHIPRFGSCRRVVGHGRSRGHFRIAESLPGRTLYHTHSPPPRKRTRNSRVPANKRHVSVFSQRGPSCIP